MDVSTRTGQCNDVSEGDEQHEELSMRILRLLLPYRRKCLRQSELVADEENTVIAIQIPRIRRFIEQAIRIDLVLPAFPSKSPNPRKVIGNAPDMAERISLNFLDLLCQRIQAIYPPGVRIVIASDGHVFADLIGVSDETVETYQREMKSIIGTNGAGHLEIFNLADVEHLAAKACNYDSLRQCLIDDYAEPKVVVKSRLMNEVHGLGLYQAITRFMFEDSLVPGYSGSRTALQRDARQRAVGVIQRSWAWGSLLEHCFPASVRLSIHPQPADSLKMGIHMMPSGDDWLTPWHAVAVCVDGHFVLMKRAEAERMNGHLVSIKGAPSHYIVEGSSLARHAVRSTDQRSFQ